MRGGTVRRKIFFITVVLAATRGSVAAQIPVPVNLYVSDLTYRDGSVQVGTPRKLTGDRGISSQPSFTPDGKAILYVSRRDSANAQSDVYRIELASRAESRITTTAEMENSPTVTPDGNMMVIRWTPATLFREWGPWIYDMKGTPLRGVLPGADTVGYYVRVDSNRFAMMRPKSRAAVAIFDSRTRTMTDYDWPVANLPPQLIRGQRAISYTRVDSLGRNQLRRLDLQSLDTSALVPAVIGRVVHTWALNGFVLMGKGNQVFALRLLQPASAWKPIATFSNSELQSVTTYVVSPDGNKLILISPVRPALHIALRDSVQSGESLAAAVKSYASRTAPNLATSLEVSEGPLIALAKEQSTRGDYSGAAALLTMTGAILPKSYDASLELGDVYRKLGDAPKALAAFRRSIALNPRVSEQEKKDAERAELAISGEKK